MISSVSRIGIPTHSAVQVGFQGQASGTPVAWRHLLRTTCRWAAGIRHGGHLAQPLVQPDPPASGTSPRYLTTLETAAGLTCSPAARSAAVRRGSSVAINSIRT